MTLNELRRILYGVEYYDVVDYDTMGKVGEICSDYGYSHNIDEKYNKWLVIGFNTETKQILISD